VNVVLIGGGGIGRHVIEHLLPDEPVRITAIVERAAAIDALRPHIPPAIAIVSSLAELPAPAPDIVVECAGHAGLGEHGAAALERGLDLLVVSVGALADTALYERLKAAAEKGGAKMLLAAGAIAGVDGLAAARQGGLDYVRYTSRKPPFAWKGTPAEQKLDLAGLREPAVHYKGPADDAARLYPQNANVAATVALAGLGFARTEVTLMADPAAPGNVHRIEAGGAFGSFSIEIIGKPLEANPKTSTLAALSVLRALRNRASAVEI
jgi:aspartate dehydrogenase